MLYVLKDQYTLSHPRYTVYSYFHKKQSFEAPAWVLLSNSNTNNIAFLEFLKIPEPLGYAHERKLWPRRGSNIYRKVRDIWDNTTH